jgi:hypothetical protein
MSFKDILVHVDATPASRNRLQLALTLAHRFGARLSGLHVIPDPSVPPYFKPSAIERIARIYAENARDAADRAEALFREETKDASAVVAWECTAGEMEERIAERARLPISCYSANSTPRTLTAFQPFCCRRRSCSAPQAPFLWCPTRGGLVTSAGALSPPGMAAARPPVRYEMRCHCSSARNRYCFSLSIWFDKGTCTMGLTHRNWPLISAGMASRSWSKKSRRERRA